MCFLMTKRNASLLMLWGDVARNTALYNRCGSEVGGSVLWCGLSLDRIVWYARVLGGCADRCGGGVL